MADLSRLKRSSSLGQPPSLDEASSNLQSPEVAPLAVVPPSVATLPRAKAEPAAAITPQKSQQAAAPAVPSSPTPAVRLDGRSLRRSGRTMTFATKVTPEFDTRLREIAQRDGLLFVEVLERALDAYEKTRPTN